MKYFSVYFCISITIISGSSSLSVFNGLKNRLRGLPIADSQCFKNIRRPLHIFNAWAKTSPCAKDPVLDGNTTHITTCGGGCNIPTLQVTCRNGLYLSDGSSFKTYTCQCDGWGDIENCTEIACDPLTIVNADVDVSGPHTYPTVVNVTCTTGYNTVDGQESYQTECRSDGTWSKNMSCSPKVCSAMELNNTKLKDNMLPALQFPFTLLVGCESLYVTSEGEDCFEASCTGDGTWNITDACNLEEIVCDPLTIVNADVDVSGPHTYPTVVNVTCTTGYNTVDGQESYQTECRSDGTWSKSMSCSPKVCSAMELNNTKLKDNMLPALQYPFTLLVGCESLYVTSEGEDCFEASCTGDGTWNITDACNLEEIVCDPLTIVNADVDVSGPHTYPTVVNVTCTMGYNTVDGQESYQTECRSDGTWSKNMSCTPKVCSTMELNNTKLKDDMLPALQYPLTLVVVCKSPYVTSEGGDCFEASCMEDGTWNITDACDTEEIACQTPIICNADVDPLPGPYIYPTSINVTCSANTVLNDGSVEYTAECQADGSWTRNDSCVAQTCPAMAQNNTKLKGDMLPQLSYPTSIIVVCESGYLTSEAGECYEAMCLEDGTWNLTDACDYDAADACPATPIFNTVQSELPVTVDGGTFFVECSGSETLSSGDTNYTATCTNGAWDMATSCGMFICEDIYTAGITTSGVYTINPDGMTPMEVYCQNDLTETGWTVIQQRLDDTTDFFLDWADYKAGFGNASSNYWLGLDNIRLLTQNMDKKLRVYMRHPDTSLGPNSDGYAWADYGTFYLDNEASNYVLHVADFTNDGGAGESLFDRSNGQPFTTKDRDNDNNGQNCAFRFKGAWWHDSCHYANLNGLYTQTATANGMNWFSYTTHDTGLTFVQMMIKTTSSG